MNKSIEWMQQAIQNNLPADPQNYFGNDWFQINDEEMSVFQLRVEDMPYLMGVYEAYEAIKDIAHNDLHSNKELCEAVRKEIGIEPNRSMSGAEFSEFAKCLRVSNRKAHAIYTKMDYWCVRSGLTSFHDEH